MKKIITVAVIALLVVCLCTVPASADTLYQYEELIVAGSNYGFTTKTLNSAQYGDIYWILPTSSLPDYEIHMANHQSYIVGDIVSCSFSVFVPSTVKSMEILIYPYRVTIDSKYYQEVSIEGEPFTLITYSFTYTYKSTANNVGFSFILHCSSGISSFGILNFIWNVRNDASIAINANNDANTDKIISNQEQNQDELINGNGGSYGTEASDNIDDVTGDITDAENAALGGKTDEEIQQEAKNTLDLDGDTLDFDSARRFTNFFDGLLLCFGGDYEVLLILSLVLGLAAFIIGRRWSNG